ncbi:hypothetical protein [Geoalkalibacter halelectricus]|uniref:hypothetical protein n=1 Tax=Geoalkalibacter halelectricus TaxID=2847045 RepID=UPI00266F080E|nr:hypothetical protein [Geoalkalibacter halelectricus]MDO3380407.1 hypothetical protein [Geoalkalibacter halelectricus]
MIEKRFIRGHNGPCIYVGALFECAKGGYQSPVEETLTVFPDGRDLGQAIEERESSLKKAYNFERVDFLYLLTA